MNIEYATLNSRVKAAVIDGILLLITLYALSEILSQFEDIPNYIKVIFFMLLFFCYDPILTSQFGGTIGHSFSKIEVKRDTDPTKNINFFMALIRYLLKIGLGWISLISVMLSDKKIAIHDAVVKSVVIYETKK